MGQDQFIYEPLREHTPSDGLEQVDRKHKSKKQWLLQGIILIQTVCLVILVALLMRGGLHERSTTDQQCAAQLSAYSPAIEAVEYETRQFPGPGQTQYRGYPTPELDAAWDAIIQPGFILLRPEELEHAKKPEKVIKIDTPDGDRYLGDIEFSHQLHCLNIIRQSTYSDYYMKLEDRPHWLKESSVPARIHIDHCIDNLRAALQCNGDANLLTKHWTEGIHDPDTDFANWHKCRKTEPLLEWKVKRRFNGTLMRPDEAMDM